jgi:hypothetical protein
MIQPALRSLVRLHHLRNKPTLSVIPSTIILYFCAGGHRFYNFFFFLWRILGWLEFLTLQRLAFYLFFRSVRSFCTPASSRAPKLTAGADTCNIISHSVEFSGIFIFGDYACLFATGLERPHIPFLISFLFASVLDSSASTLIFAFYFLVFACARLYT